MPKLIIRGVTQSGGSFRPSDWAERLYYAVAEYGPNRQPVFNPHVMMKVVENIKCVEVDQRLDDAAPLLFDFLVGFAKDNKLVVTDEAHQPIADYN